MAPFPEEVDVFSVPHSRMKRLVEVYNEKLGCTDFADYGALESLLHELYQTFREFRCHEQIENQLIMTKLKKKLKALSIHDSAVCNCHSDNRLSDMLALVRDGYSCTNKSATERLNYGLRLQHALIEFTEKFLPHMKEEEEVFQPMLIQYFGYEELKLLKEKVIQEHTRWQEQCAQEKCCVELENIDQKADSDEDDVDELLPSWADLPQEILLDIFSRLNARDLSISGGVCKSWYSVSREPALWKDLMPVHWALGIWDQVPLWPDPYYESNQGKGHADEDADFDESSGSSSDEDSASSSAADTFKREAAVLHSLVKYFLPVVGRGVRKIVLATSHALNSRLLRSILKLCPMVRHLDISYTDVGDTSFKGLEESGACSQLEHVDLSGCSLLTDVVLCRIARCLLRRRGAENSANFLPSVDPCDQYGNDSTSSSLSWNSLDAWDELAANASQSIPFVMHTMGRFCDGCPFRSRCSGVVCVRAERDRSESDAGTPDSSSSKITARENPGDNMAGGLRHLNLSGCFNITDSGLLFLSNWDLLNHLEYLDVSGCFQLTGDGLRELMLGTPRLQPTNLFYCDYVDNGPFQDSANGCQNLQCFSRACCQSGE
uniref:Putative leucine rich repeat some n=1 Tax=Amblyomma aureolatum TaxID=187763 RepID=A0A1E1X610_9ACAR